ncbi:histidine phosphatase family protein [Streptomyces racemochromogenes]|uniref:Histidine phosphatase family protein n=1 Tax=Streptomyces racemochromogenes TaxID=67353 RepID=A0ABW7P942_9ACTN
MPEQSAGERRMVLVRHAKAVPKHVTEDFDRALSDRGSHDAPLAGEWLERSGFAVDLALCSPARRTRQTWQLMLPRLSQPPPTLYQDRLYEGDADDLLSAVGEVAAEVTGLALVGHNPAVHDLAKSLCGGGPEELVEHLRTAFPKSAVAVLALDGGWGDVAPGTARLAAFWTPGDDD